MENEGTPLEMVPGIGPVAAKKLREHHIVNAEYLARQSYSSLSWETKLGEATCHKIVTNARELLGYEFHSGLELESSRSSDFKLTTGVETVDRKLRGGIPTGSLVEVYGPSRGGKSHLMIQLAVRAQLPPEQGGLESKVLWLMTGLSFRSLSVRAAAFRYGVDGDTALNNIAVQEVVNREHLQDILKTLPEVMARTGTRVVVIDSLGGLFQVEYATLCHRSVMEKELAQVMRTLRNITRAGDGVCIYTNQVFEHITNYGGNPNSPMNGHIMRHGSDYRFFLRKRAREKRGLSLQKAPDVPEFDAEIEIGWGGFYSDARERKISEREIYDMLDELFIKKTSESEGVEVIG